MVARVKMTNYGKLLDWIVIYGRAQTLASDLNFHKLHKPTSGRDKSHKSSRDAVFICLAQLSTLHSNKLRIDIGWEVERSSTE